VSTKGIYTALSGAIAQSQRLETTANNIANVNTPGFKKDTQTFREYLTAYEKEPEVIQVPRVPASIESFYDMQGGDKSYVDSSGTYSDLSQGGLKSTGNPLDVAIEGKGYFEVGTPLGVRYSRNGGFSLDGKGQLVTKEGWPILKSVSPGSAPGSDPAGRIIKVENGGSINISVDGEISQGGQSLGKLSIVNVSDEKALKKEGSSMFSLKPNFNAQVTNIDQPKLQQGFIETSNVNIVNEMTDMITATRLFESTQRAIQAYDTMADKLVNVVPKSN
jgi:flagellar basal-body rod protein FlgG